MKSKKKIIIISAAFILCAIIAMIPLHMHMYYKARELTSLDNWETNIRYSMLSKKLKNVISEEEFNDRTDAGKYNMYRKLEGLVLEATDRDTPSTDWWKTPPCDAVTTDEGRFWVEYRIDFKVHFNRIEVINFVTYIHSYEEFFEITI